MSKEEQLEDIKALQLARKERKIVRQDATRAKTEVEKEEAASQRRKRREDAECSEALS